MGWSQGFSEEKTEPSPVKVPLTSFFSSVVLGNHDFEKVGMAMKVDTVVLNDELRTYDYFSAKLDRFIRL